jgi:hypothetical protein
MMLAKRKDLDVPDDDHITAGRLKNRMIEGFFWRSSVASGKEFPGSCHTLGGFQKAFSCWVFTEFQKKFTDEFGDAFYIHGAILIEDPTLDNPSSEQGRERKTDFLKPRPI